MRVTYTDGFDGLPVFSPDGKRLCWTSGRTPDGKSQLFLADWNHAAALEALDSRSARLEARASWPRNQSPKIDAATKPQTDIAESQIADFPRRSRRKTCVPRLAILASDELEGRMTGSRGSQLAAEFIADNLRRAGLKPFGDRETYFQNFEFNSGVKVVTNKNSLAWLIEQQRLPHSKLKRISARSLSPTTTRWKAKLFSPVTVCRSRQSRAKVTILMPA